MRGEEGQALPITLLLLGVGSIMVMPFLTLTSNGLMASRDFAGLQYGQYAADAGAEDALWRLRYGGLTTTLLTLPGFTTTYPLSQTVNGVSASVTVTMQRTTLAQDDFESGDWSGGTGWLAAWSQSGNSSVTNAGTPHGGSRHARLRNSTGYIERRLSLSGHSDVRLQFWAKVNSFEGSDSAALLVGPTGSLSTARTWTSADSDNTYHAYDIDLSTYSMAGSFSVAYDANMSATNDYLYVDDIFVAEVRYNITVTAGSTTLNAQATTHGTQVVIYSWVYS
ncbi:MAG: hypothetical protein V1724_10425, partial [Chloroflexota bacterium]